MAARIIIKKKGGHGGHNGGAWKVAYADFVTAMMALFIVLWLMNSSKEVQQAVGGYFKDPSGTSKLLGGGGMPGTGENFQVSKENMSELKDALQKAMSKVANFDKIAKHIEVTVTGEGLRIELSESAGGTFFDLGSAAPSQTAKDLLTALAQEISKLPNHVSVEGHTDSRPYGSEAYSNWELSVDRANVARRIMCQNGLPVHQVAQVRGYADQHLRHPENPEDPGNRRISLIVEYLEPSGGQGGKTVAEGESEGHAGKSEVNPVAQEAPKTSSAGASQGAH